MPSIFFFFQIISAILIFLSQTRFQVPYGKLYSKKRLEDLKIKTSKILKSIPGNEYITKYVFMQIPTLYAWIIQTSPSIIFSMLAFTFSKSKEISGVNRLIFMMYIFHYLHRAFVYPVLMYSDSKKTVPVAISILSIIFCINNGILQGQGAAQTQYYQLWTFFGLITWARVIVGLLIFCLGFWFNVLSDRQLRIVKKSASEEDKYTSESGSVYVLPRGGLFELVTNPHYLGEIIEWTGYFIAAFNWESLAFLFSSVLFLSARGKQNHDWYLKTFKNYPSERFIVIPFLY